MKKIFVSLVCIFALCAQLLVGCSGSTKETKASKFEYETGADGIIITNYTGSDKKVIIPAVIANKKVTGINKKAFAGNVILEEIVFPESCTGSFDFSCVRGCDALKKITFKGKINSIIIDSKYTLPSFEELFINKIDADKIQDFLKRLVDYESEGTSLAGKIVINEVNNYSKLTGVRCVNWQGISSKESLLSIPLTLPQDFVDFILQGEVRCAIKRSNWEQGYFFNYDDDEFNETANRLFSDWYEDEKEKITDDIRMCLALGVTSIKVNGKSYSSGFSIFS